MPPCSYAPHMFIDPCTFVCPLWVYTPHMFPYSSVHLYVLRGFCMLWDCKGPPYLLDTSLTPPSVWGCLPICLHPTDLFASPCICMFQGYLYVIWGIFPSSWGFGGVFPSVGGFGGISTWVFFYILVVHNVSHFYYGYDYYSSSYGSVFWAVICFISDHGSFPDGASCNIGSV